MKTLPFLSLVNVCAGYDKRTVISDIQADVEAGSLAGILGPNGVGKSTLLKCISGVLPHTGQVLLEGRDLEDFRLRERAQRIAVVPQLPPADTGLSVHDVVLMGRTPYVGLWKRESAADYAAADRAMEMADVTPLRDRNFDTLSGGEKQRVQIARALAQEPSLLLFDEPTASLDPGHELALMELITSLVRDAGKTALIVLHDINLAARYCDKILLLGEGSTASNEADNVTTRVAGDADGRVAADTAGGADGKVVADAVGSATDAGGAAVSRLYAFGTPEEVLTEQALAEVYGIAATIRTDDVTGKLYIVSRHKI